MARIISFINQKGGVGKTTTCVNVSAYLGLYGKKVLIVDLDPQGNASSNVGINKEDKPKTIYDVMVDDNTVDEVIQKTKFPNLDVIPANVDLAGAEIELVSMVSRETRLKNALEEVKEKYDYIFIDCPPSLGLITLNSFTAADSVLVPIQCEYYALEGLGQLVNTIKLVQKHLNKKLVIEGVLLTMFDSIFIKCNFLAVISI